MWLRIGFTRFLLIICSGFFILSAQAADDPSSLCRSARATKSCGECITQHPECAWCVDPLFAGNFRCDVKSELSRECQPTYVYQPRSELDRAEDAEIGTKKTDQTTVFQLQPQKVKIKMKPGETVHFDILYYHNTQQPSNVAMLNSETNSQGLRLSYAVNCRGQELKGHLCRGVSYEEKVRYNVTVTLKECKTAGDIAVSIGVAGVRDVVAVYVTPLCGCNCEKVQQQEQRSAHCSGYGTLVCGACLCDQGRGGSRCDCDLRNTGAATADALDDRCRAKPNEAVCSGNGKCNCGVCECTKDMVSGQFCECDDMACAMADGKLCAGNGECTCGECRCADGWLGDACDCPTNTATCKAEDGSICSDHGSCECGRCMCETDYRGKICELSANGLEPTEEPDDEPSTEPSTEGDGDGGLIEEETTPKQGAAVILSQLHWVWVVVAMVLVY